MPTLLYQYKKTKHFVQDALLQDLAFINGNLSILLNFRTLETAWLSLVEVLIQFGSFLIKTGETLSDKQDHLRQYFRATFLQVNPDFRATLLEIIFR